MSAVPAAGYLADFSTDGDARPPRAGSANALRKEGADAASKIDEAYSRGVDSGRVAAEADLEARLQEQQAEFDAQLAAARQEWAAGTGEELANLFRTALDEFEGRVTETAARILKPFLAAALHRQTVDELKASLEALVTSDSGVSMSISGPADVIDVLRAQLAGRIAAATFTPTDGCDVRIVAGQATLETCLKDWMAKLDEAAP